MKEHELIARAQNVLRLNDAGDFTKPSLGQYPHQWNWDSALIALGWAHFDLPRAFAEVHSLLAAQWRDGMVPHIIYPTGASAYFPPPEFWRTDHLAHGGVIQSSGLTQPPLVATMVRIIHERTRSDESRVFVREVFPKILGWHRWLHTARDADGTGLPCIFHPWESGADNSPRWSPALDRITPTDLPPFKRRDTQFVSSDERPLAPDYERFVHLIDLGRRMSWEPRALIERMPFAIQDVMLAAILHRADEDLRALAIELGEPTQELDAWLARTRENFDAQFWDEARGLYFDFDIRARAPIRVNACHTFAPLFAGLASPAQAARLVNEHFNSPNEYASSDNSRYGLPSTAKNEPGYAPRRYWCGPVWIQINWIIAQGLLRYGYVEQAEQLRRDSLALVEQSGFREYFDPRDGTGCGATEFSWSAALTLEFLHQGKSNG